jgi:hypothetical protein
MPARSQPVWKLRTTRASTAISAGEHAVTPEGVVKI